MKRHERESFLKSFLIFFLTLELLLGVIAFFYVHDRSHQMREQLFLQMKSYSLTLEEGGFEVSIEPASSGETLRLLESDSAYYAFFPVPASDEFVLKISRSKALLAQAERDERLRTAAIFGVLSLLAAIFAFFYSLYALGPLRRALGMTEEFLKDMIHDLNTPVSALLINARLLRKGFDEARIKRIEQSAQTIGSLHENLKGYFDASPLQSETIAVASAVADRVAYFAALYGDLRFETRLDGSVSRLNKEAFTRILDNLLSNAAKYNRDQGVVRVVLENKKLIVADTGTGIKNPSRVFERFYKEGSRGLGIGLHIVKKLCDQTGIVIAVESSPEGSVFTLILP
ncbi:MAG: sensor histidine kinase [Campylobacterales bacterium]